MRIKITHVCFGAIIHLILAWSIGRCLNKRPSNLVFKHFPRDLAHDKCINKYVSGYTRFFVRKIGYINFVPKSVRRPSVRLSVRPSVTFLVIVSSPKPLEVAT